jgi:hypothetical protein
LAYPPAIGGTTPAAGTFTTLTAQTEVLKGTGQNYLLQSQALATSPWSAAGAGVVTNNVTTAPDGTTTAAKISETAVTNFFAASQNPSSSTVTLAGSRMTFSFYAKSAERTQISVSFTVSVATVFFDLSAGTVVSSSGSNYVSSSITSVGSGWYRCSVVFTASGSSNPFYFILGPAVGGTGTYAGTLGSGVYAWGTQLEIGSTANTYVPTTTTAVYGTPTLSFSGVAGLGLQSDGSLYVSPAGTGALQAQATTSSTVGGNARGANAVDWQTARSSASQVANGTLSFIGGGYGNTASQYNSTVVGGYQNNVSQVASFIGAGSSNTASGSYGAIVSGVGNTTAGYMNFIGGGFTNSGTSGSAVTTQSGTMNGTTAVTLSGSNANIKTGQLVTGTSIASDTYVSGISGTSLTLSKNASGSSTSTLSFFTPHGVVVGGGNNQATGSYSFIGGGGDAGTAANRNVASGDWSFVGGGIRNQATGYGSVIVGGGGYAGVVIQNNSTGSSSFIGAGFGNNNSAFAGFLGAGYGNTVNSQYGVISGGSFGSTRSIAGYQAFPANNTPISQSTGITQAGLLVLAVQTTDATATVLRSDSSAASTTNQVILPNNAAYHFKGSVIANVTGAANGAAWSFEGAIMRGANAASTVLINTPSINRIAASSGATAWTIALTADTTNGGLTVTATGAAATTIRWVAKLETTEVTF